jgi:hypothetical protein
MAEELQVKSIGSQPYQSGVRFHDLPAEVHEAILDHLFGERVSALTMGAPGKSARNWSRCLRHPRRKVLSDLALISPVWRVLVQDRIYRHSQCACHCSLFATNGRDSQDQGHH